MRSCLIILLGMSCLAGIYPVRYVRAVSWGPIWIIQSNTVSSTQMSWSFLRRSSSLRTLAYGEHGIDVPCQIASTHVNIHVHEAFWCRRAVPRLRTLALSCTNLRLCISCLAETSFLAVLEPAPSNQHPFVLSARRMPHVSVYSRYADLVVTNLPNEKESWSQLSTSWTKFSDKDCPACGSHCDYTHRYKVWWNDRYQDQNSAWSWEQCCNDWDLRMRFVLGFRTWLAYSAAEAVPWSDGDTFTHKLHVL